MSDTRAALNIFRIFFTVAIFWALYDQTGSTWVLQAQKMNLKFLGFQWEASQIQALSPALVLLMIPLFSTGIYPGLKKIGFELSALKKMGIGMFLTALSFVVVGFAEILIESGQTPSVGWQWLAYIILTAAEIMVSITGLEFAYTQSPKSMKSTLMGFWFLTIFMGNLFTAWIAGLNPFPGSTGFFFYAVLMAGVAGVFGWFAKSYVSAEHQSQTR